MNLKARWRPGAAKAPALDIRARAPTRACARTYRRMRTHARIRAHMHMHADAHAHAHAHTHAHTHTHTHIRMLARTHARARAHTHAHTCRCTHTQARKHARTNQLTSARERKHVPRRASPPAGARLETRMSGTRMSGTRMSGDSDVWGLGCLRRAPLRPSLPPPLPPGQPACRPRRVFSGRRIHPARPALRLVSADSLAHVPARASAGRRRPTRRASVGLEDWTRISHLDIGPDTGGRGCLDGCVAGPAHEISRSPLSPRHVRAHRRVRACVRACVRARSCACVCVSPCVTFGHFCVRAHARPRVCFVCVCWGGWGGMRVCGPARAHFPDCASRRCPGGRRPHGPGETQPARARAAAARGPGRCHNMCRPASSDSRAFRHADPRSVWWEGDKCCPGYLRHAVVSVCASRDCFW